MPHSDMLIKFADIRWHSPAPGVREKKHTGAKHSLRLLEFSHGFVEKDWCTKGHIGFVLEGILRIDFDGQLQVFEAGDGLWIEAGHAQKHKAVLAAGEKVLLLLFEENG